jgi:hypothetical protein
MRKQQTRANVEATFAFGETELNYSLRYGSSVREVVSDYFEIIPQRKFLSRRDWSKLWFGALLTLVAVAAVAAQTYVEGAQLLSALWFAPALVVLTGFVFVQDHFRVFSASGEPILILEGSDASAIIAEIQLRRRDRIAQVYGQINHANEPELEINKIEWLVLESVFTRDQADKQIAMVQAHVTEQAAAANAMDAMPQFFAREALAI